MDGELSLAVDPTQATSNQGGGWDLSQQPAQLTAPATITPSGGEGQGQGQGIYTPNKPDYLSYNPTGGAGLNDLTKFYQTLYSNVGDPGRAEEPRQKFDNEPIHQYTPTPAPTPESDAASATPSNLYKLSGTATTFGLQPNTVVNSDGTVDTKYLDPGDKGWGAFGYNTRDPKLVGASLPVDVIKQSIGDYTTDAGLIRQIKDGNYKVVVTNAKGQTETMPLVDAGPANWTGNLVDLTYGATKKLGLTGKDQVSVQLVGQDGNPIEIKGFHPSTIQKGWAPRATEAKSREEEEAGPTGVADFFRKRGDEPIKTNDDPRLTDVKVGDQTWRVHQEAAPYFQGFLNDLQKAGAPVTSAGGWNYREKVGAKGISEHAFGGAIDVNQTGRDKVSPDFKKWIDEHPGELQTLEERWHIYGGERFHDLGHFEWGGTPSGSELAPAEVGKLPTRKEAELAPAEVGEESGKSLLDRYDELLAAGEKNISSKFNPKEFPKLLDLMHDRLTQRAEAHQIQSALLTTPGMKTEQGFETDTEQRNG